MPPPLTATMAPLNATPAYTRLLINLVHGLVKEEKKIGVAYVTTAVELSEEKKQNVKVRLLQTTQYKEMEMNYSVDESLIGGMVIRIKDRVVDSSVRTKLEEMKKQLLQIQLG